MYELVDAAKEYLSAGLHLLALVGKRPNPRVHGDHWSWDDSIWGTPTGADEAKLQDAFGGNTTGIAILIPQHVLVADVDSDRAAALFLSMTDLPTDTRVAKSPHGLHIWYVAPGAEGSVWLGDEVDGRALLFKGFGGYVVAPPSRNDEGERYRWLGDWSVVDFIPDAVEKRIADRKALDSLSSPYPPAPAPRSLVPVFASGRWTGGYGHIDIEGLRQAIIDAKDGNQNNVIYWAACSARDDGVPLDATLAALLSAAAEGNHPQDRARSAIRSAYKRRMSE